MNQFNTTFTCDKYRDQRYQDYFQRNINNNIQIFVFMKTFIGVLIGWLGIFISVEAQVDTISGNIYQFNGNLGIGTSLPQSGLTLRMNQPVVYPEPGILNIMNNHYATFDGYAASDIHYVGSLLNGRRSRGTLDFPLNVEPGDRISGMTSALFYNEQFRFNASILFYAGQGLGYDSYPSYIVFNTTAAGEWVYNERMRLSGEGNLGIGTTQPSSKIHVADGDIYIEDFQRGVIMKSPDGQSWRGTVDDTGQLNFVPVTCPELVTGHGDSDKTGSQFGIFPNPAGDKITLDLTNQSEGKVLYTVQNTEGIAVKSGNFYHGETKLDVSSLPSGVYFITLTDETGSSLGCERFIKQ